jgi:pyruvate formate lyase activating enzyme
MERREFLTRLAVGATGVAGCGLVHGLACGTAGAQDAVDFTLPEGEKLVSPAPALHYEPIGDQRLICHLCPRECRVADQERGYCGVRENRGGEYYTLVHNRVCSANVDPIEKKPFFHFLPGTQALSIATAGCNMECRFCQNWQISQFRPEQVASTEATPEGLLRVARQKGAPSIAYTYTEPTVYYEYMLAVARYTAPQGIRNVVVSNGYILEAPLRELAPHLAAYKVDLKAFTEGFYRDQCSGRLEPVLRTLKVLKSLGLWTEIVVLVIPTLNDDDESNRAMFAWIASELGPDIPVHLTRFHPTYKIQNLPDTPVATLERLHALAKAAGLQFVYLGNLPGHAAESTYCPGCGKRVVERFGYVLGRVDLRDGRCSGCGRLIPGVWS